MSREHKGPKILIVDDEKSNITFLMSLLKHDYRILAATSGEKALEIAFAGNPPDLILLDILMPGLDGYRVCQRLKGDERTKHIPIIFVTAVSEATDETYGFSLGAVDYITKPFHPAVVKARVKTHVDLKFKTDLLEELASVDGLTNIPNRRRFDQVLEAEWSRMQRSDTPLSLVMIDIDHFKLYNDHYGHAMGDHCLRQVATILTGTLNRPGDLLARYGGEEMAALLPATDAEASGHIAEEMRKAVEAMAIPHACSPVVERVTISVGVACTVNGDAIESAEALVDAADTMLYESKRQGRNRVTVAGTG